jgi:Icc-related predicted phosphoesterase
MRSRSVRLTIISDTHSQHEALGILSGDVLIHCGDACNGLLRDPLDVEEFDEWLGHQNFDRILCIGGNHDFAFAAREERGRLVLENAEYLVDERYEYRGRRFYGSPWTPELESWAYYADADELAERWRAIPDDTDVLITHTPPLGILDRTSRGIHCGCPRLRARVEELRPAVHCFGHVHRSAGRVQLGSTAFVNASAVDSRYRVVNPPIELEI